MADKLKRGDRVSWKSHGGTAEARVVRKLTSHIKIKGHEVAADKDDPQYLVETDERKRAAHTREALTKV